MIKRFRIKRLLRYYWVNLVKWANSGKYILVDEREQRGKLICLRLMQIKIQLLSMDLLSSMIFRNLSFEK